MFSKKGKKGSKKTNFVTLENSKKIVKGILVLVVLCIAYKAFVVIPYKEIKNQYYVEIATQGENGEAVTSKVKITEARSICHFDSLRQVQEIAANEDLPEDFNPNAFYENQFVLCLRAIGL